MDMTSSYLLNYLNLAKQTHDLHIRFVMGNLSHLYLAQGISVKDVEQGPELMINED